MRTADPIMATPAKTKNPTERPNFRPGSDGRLKIPNQIQRVVKNPKVPETKCFVIAKLCAVNKKESPGAPGLSPRNKRPVARTTRKANLRN
jgi:hypothetical protein